MNNNVWMRDWADPYTAGGEASSGQTNPLINAADASHDVAAVQRGHLGDRAAAKLWETQAHEMEHLAQSQPSETVKSVGERLQQAHPSAVVSYQPTELSLGRHMNNPEDALCWQVTAQVGDDAVVVTEDRAGIEDVMTTATHEGPVGAVKGYETAFRVVTGDGKLSEQANRVYRFTAGKDGVEDAFAHATNRLDEGAPTTPGAADEGRVARDTEVARQLQMNQMHQSAPGAAGLGLNL